MIEAESTVELPQMKVKRSMQVEHEGEASFPETRLWCAVIASAIEEYQEWLQRVNVSWSLEQKPVNRSYLMSLKQIRQQCSSDWFTMICELADIDPKKVFRRFDVLDKEFCLTSIPFEDESAKFMSNWEMQKVAKTKFRLLS